MGCCGSQPTEEEAQPDEKTHLLRSPLDLPATAKKSAERASDAEAQRQYNTILEQTERQLIHVDVDAQPLGTAAMAQRRKSYGQALAGEVQSANATGKLPATCIKATAGLQAVLCQPVPPSDLGLVQQLACSVAEHTRCIAITGDEPVVVGLF
eukprot:m.92655 g.92655  ORF g.92655 m.92655 type:complete len:153 (-) comp15071_c0_seq7:1417-1875(-)